MVDHHWMIYRKEEVFIPDLNKFGFVYLITNLKNGKGYIGCKQYLMYRKMKETESNWKTYMGSSKWLLKDIEKMGKEHFKFEIIAEYKNRRSLRYYELYYQMKFNVLSSTLEEQMNQLTIIHGWVVSSIVLLRVIKILNG